MLLEMTGNFTLSRNLPKRDGRVVEFVVAERHGIEAHLVHELGGVVALVGRVEQRTLKLVAGIENDDVAAVLRKRGAALIYLGLDAGNAAETFVLALFFGRAGGIKLVDRLDARVLDR